MYINTDRWNIKKKKKGQMILCAKLKQRHRRREQMYGYQGGKGARGTGDWDRHIYTIDTVHKID